MANLIARKRVLLVSGDPKFFEDPENAFQTRGCDVFTAMSDTEAVSFLEAHGADLVILQGVPASVTAAELSRVLGDDRHAVIVADKGEKVRGFSKLDNVTVVQAPIEGRSLLKTSHKLLGVTDRKYISILVQVRVTEPKVTTIFGKSRDLSVGGILVETNQSLNLHDNVVVSFLIPGADRMLQSDAVVMREVVRAGGGRRYGLQFVGMSNSDKQVIADFVGAKPEK